MDKELKKRVRNGYIGAITLDTSIFDAQGLRLESGLLRQLEQFQYNNSTKLILSEVVKEETLAHLAEKAKDAQREVGKSLKQAKDYWLIGDRDIEEIQRSIFNGLTAQEIASKRFDQFADFTSLEIVEAQNHVEVSDLLLKYFTAKPPFSETGKKKNEFPDAIALMSLEAWANQNQTKIIVLTLDQDWKNYCKSSDSLIAIEDFAGALGLFQLENADDICKYLSEIYQKGKLHDVKDAISDALEDQINNFNFSSEAWSNFIYEHESTEVTVYKFQFKLFEPPNLIFRPINFDDETLVAEARLSVDVNIKCVFSFSSYDSIDGDEISLGTSSVNIETNLDASVLVSFVGSLDKIGAEIEVDNVELEYITPDVVDFGEIEPDWMQEDYEY